ncbi:MAG: glycosyltransferase [Steroidobacteraceae bacterium]
MRNALHIVSTSGLYGAERVLLELSQFLKQNSWNAQVLAIDGAGATPLVVAAGRMGIQAESFGRASSGTLGFAKRIAHYLDERSIDIVHSHGYKPNILLAMTGQPRRRVCIATCHSWYSNTLRLRAYEWLDKRALRSFHHVAAVSGEIERRLLAAQVSRSRVTVIKNGLDPEIPSISARRVIREQLGVPPGGLLLLRVGRLVAPKGNAILLHALAELPSANWRLAFVGGGEQLAETQQLAHSLGIASVTTFCGFRENVADYLAAADLFVSPSVSEGLPMVLLEAMAAGLPIVSTNVGEIPRVITSEKDGLLVPPGDVQPLRDALNRAMTNSSQRARWGDEARRTYSEGYSRRAMGVAYLKIYDAAMQRR